MRLNFLDLFLELDYRFFIYCWFLEFLIFWVWKFGVSIIKGLILVTGRWCPGMMKRFGTSHALSHWEDHSYPTSRCGYVDVSVDYHIRWPSTSALDEYGSSILLYHFLQHAYLFCFIWITSRVHLSVLLFAKECPVGVYYFVTLIFYSNYLNKTCLQGSPLVKPVFLYC